MGTGDLACRTVCAARVGVCPDPFELPPRRSTSSEVPLRAYGGRRAHPASGGFGAATAGHPWRSGAALQRDGRCTTEWQTITGYKPTPGYRSRSQAARTFDNRL
jgi:hypothetical protein